MNRGRRLTRDIADRGRHEAGRATNLAPALVDGPAHGSHRRVVLLADVEDDLIGADGIGSQDRAIHHEVWPVGHQDPVLGARRLAFRSVHHDDGSAVPVLRQRTPLSTHGEAGSAPAEQTTRLQVREEVVMAIGGRHGAEPGEVRVEALRVAIQWRAGEESMDGLVRGQQLLRSKFTIEMPVATDASPVGDDGATWQEPTRPEDPTSMRHRTGRKVSPVPSVADGGVWGRPSSRQRRGLTGTVRVRFRAAPGRASACRARLSSLHGAGFEPLVISATGGPGRAPSVVVAGHVCLDIIPGLGPGGDGQAPGPGTLELVGPATLAIGGCVGNTGVALHRLGLRTKLVARIGDDPFGAILKRLVHAAVPRRDARLIATPGGQTSYSVIQSRPDLDRAIRHFPGVNDRFVAADVAPAVLNGAALLHVGYPPLMASLVADDGLEIGRLMAAAHRHEAMTSLDMAAANLDQGVGGIRWRELLRRILPEVDLFLPSLDEAAHLLEREVRRDGRGAPVMTDVVGLADELLDLGVAVAGLKLGEHGLYVRTAPGARIDAVPGSLGPAWVDRELYSAVFETRVVGTTGAGDATIAGFIHGLVGGMAPEASVTAACAVGGASTEAADGTSAIPAWPEIQARLGGDWQRTADTPGPDWTPALDPGLWVGPRDRVARRRR